MRRRNDGVVLIDELLQGANVHREAPDLFNLLDVFMLLIFLALLDFLWLLGLECGD